MDHYYFVFGFCFDVVTFGSNFCLSEISEGRTASNFGLAEISEGVLFCSNDIFMEFSEDFFKGNVSLTFCGVENGSCLLLFWRAAFLFNGGSPEGLCFT